MSSEPIFFSCVSVVNCRDVYQGSDVWEISLLRWMHNSALYPAVDLSSSTSRVDLRPFFDRASFRGVAVITSV